MLTIVNNSDYFSVISSFLNNNDKNSLYTTSSRLRDNLKENEEYMRYRTFHLRLSSNFGEFKLKLKANLDNTDKKKLYLVSSYFSYDGLPMCGCGYYNGTFCYFKHTEVVIRKKFRLNANVYYDEEDESTGEWSHDRYDRLRSQDDWYNDPYFEITFCDQDNILLSAYYMYLCYAQRMGSVTRMTGNYNLEMVKSLSNQKIFKNLTNHDPLLGVFNILR